MRSMNNLFRLLWWFTNIIPDTEVLGKGTGKIRYCEGENRSLERIASKYWDDWTFFQ